MKSKDADKQSSARGRVDHEQQAKYKFDPLYLDVKYPDTAILLLKCKEKPILLAAAAALAKFGSKAEQNLEILFDLELVDSVIPLIEHEDLFTRRFAAKLLAEMTIIPSVRDHLLNSDYYIPHFAKVLINDRDMFMQEFSSLILAQLSRDMYGAARVLKQCPNMNFLFERIQSPDPDVKRNNIEIMYNLMQDLTGTKEIMEAKDFNLTPIYDLFESPYPEIQRLAINVITDLVSKNRDESLQDLFRRSKGLQALLKFLDNEEWQDLHAEVLGILCLASDNSTTVELLEDVGGIKQILKYMEDSQSSRLFVAAFDVAVRLAHTAAGRKALHSYGIIDYLLRTLKGTVEPDTYEITCHGIGMMTLYNPAAKELTAENCISNVLDILKNQNLKWPARQAALFALSELLKCDVQNCENFLKVEGQNHLVRLISESMGKIPIEVQIGVVETLTTIARRPGLRSTIINVDTIDAMCSTFQYPCRSMTELKIACCNALSIFAIDKIGRDIFLQVNGPRRLYNLLSDVESIPTRSAAVRLVQLLCADPVLSASFVANKYLPYMINNRSSARAIPSWDTCIEALFDSHLPIKFAFTGRLSLHDVTQDGFYVLRRNVCPFPVLDDIFRFKFCPLEPVYIVNCTRPIASASLDKSDERNSEDAEAPSWVPLTRESLTFYLKFSHLRCDTHLNEYIELFKCKLFASESKDSTQHADSGLANIRYIVSRARMLGKFVARQMSGPDPNSGCADHQLEIHLKEIKDRIETSVIPLGMLRVGSFLERALLFKVIADRIGLPAALVRGEYGKAWVEVAVPQIETPNEEVSFDVYIDRDKSCPEFVAIVDSERPSLPKNVNSDKVEATLNHRETIFPTKLMKPNFIVDLMNVPGDLLPIGSHRARMYCERQLSCNTTCCD